MKVIEKIFTENKGLKRILAEKLWRTESNINMLLKNNKFTVTTKIKWTIWINSILWTNYFWPALFSEIDEKWKQ